MKRFTHWLVCFVCVCTMLIPCNSVAQIKAVSPQPMKLYSIRDGNMYIELSKRLSKSSLDSFIKQYNLTDLSIGDFIKTNSFDHLQKLGWKLESNGATSFVITKPLTSSTDLGDFAKKIVYTEKQNTTSARFPVESDNVIYGFNQFSRYKHLFAVKGNDVTFFLRNNLQSKKVMLAGSFNDWNPDALAMKKTDSGWIAHVQLRPGKYWYKFIADGNWMEDDDNLQREDDGYGNTNSVYFKSNVIFHLDTFVNAKQVLLTASFNHWNDKQLRMLKTAHGWVLPLYLATGTHTYKFMVDGKGITDPKNAQRLPDGHNSFNSVLALGTPYLFKLNGFTNAKHVMLTGTFNDWREDELAMTKKSAGWELPYILRGGMYEYKFIVDGTQIIDPDNSLTISNEHDTKNSLLIIDPNYTFTLKGFAGAKAVYLSGDFNNWAPDALPMKRDGDAWKFSVHLAPGKHKYKFVVDGNWITDPGNKLWEQNEYDTGNSVVWITE